MGLINPVIDGLTKHLGRAFLNRLLKNMLITFAE